MPPPAQLSSDNLLHFLQVRRDPASAEEIAAALHMRRADRHALDQMLGKLKKRRLIAEVQGGRYRLAGRKEEQSGGGQSARERAQQARGKAVTAAPRDSVPGSGRTAVAPAQIQ